MTQAASQMSAAQANSLQRRAVLQSSIEMIQQIFSTTIAAPGSQNNLINIPPRNVGLLKKFIVVISGTANNTDGANAASISDLGLGNLLSQVVFTDLNNNVRIQTSGWHLDMLHRARFRWETGATLLAGAQISNGVYGNNFAVTVAPTGFAHATSQPFQAVLEIPIAYSDEDLRGAVYMNVVNAVANLALTLNPTPFVAAGVDSTLACWKGASGNISNVTVTIYQVYLDQLPKGNNGIPVLPVLDLATVYEIKNTTNPNPFVATQDNQIPYANFRDFLSTFLIYNHDPSADAGRVGGGDINYFALQSANFTNIFKYTPTIAAMKARQLMYMDLPLGSYYFSSRRKPISTSTYGNMQLLVNPITAAAGAYGLIGWEDFALTNVLQSGAGSLGI